MFYNIVLLLLLTIGGSAVFWLLLLIISKEKTEVFFNYSAWIGFFERMIIYSAFVTNNLIFVSVLITLKGLVRFPEISSKNSKLNAEKFLLGTMFSIIYTFIIFRIF